MYKFRGHEINDGVRYLPPGTHECEIFLNGEKEFKNAQGITRKVASIGFRDATGQVVFEDYYLHREALWKLGILFTATRIKKEDVDLSDLVGERVLVQVIKEEYEKREGGIGTKSVVKAVFPIGTHVTEYDSQDEEDIADVKKNDPF